MSLHSTRALCVSVIRERSLESLINRTVEQAILVHLHPRTAINITIQEMQSDGLVRVQGIRKKNERVQGIRQKGERVQGIREKDERVQ